MTRIWIDNPRHHVMKKYHTEFEGDMTYFGFDEISKILTIGIQGPLKEVV